MEQGVEDNEQLWSTPLGVQQHQAARKGEGPHFVLSGKRTSSQSEPQERRVPGCKLPE